MSAKNQDKRPGGLFGAFRKSGKPEHGQEPQKSAEDPARTIARLEEQVASLEHAVKELSVLNDLARAIGGSRSSQQIIDRIVNRTMRAVGAEQVVINLAERDTQKVDGTYIRVGRKSQQFQKFHLTDALFGWMYLHKAPLLSNDPQEDERLKGLACDSTVTSLLCVPLLVKSELIGILAACNKKGTEGFSEDDKRLLSIIATQSAQIIENVRLSEEEAAYALMRKEVELAREIQNGLLPAKAPDLPGYEIAGRTVPAQSVGGDYFDFFRTAEDKMAICLGDVSGKGIPASLLMANLQATLRGNAQFYAEVHECLIWSNRLLFRSTADDKFATLFYGVLDHLAHTLTYCSAGHERPLLIASQGSGEPRCLERGGLALGILDEFAYQSEKVELAPGDLLLIYSDGATDAMNSQAEFFGLERLQEAFCKVRQRTAEEVVESLVQAVQDHAGETAQMDDITVLALRRLPGA